MQAQRTAGGELELLRGRVGEMLSDGGPGADLSREMVDLRLALNQINPNGMSDQSFVRKLLRVIPFAEKLSPAAQVLERIYEPVSKQVTVIESRLKDGRALLARDNVELRKLYEQVDSQQLPIQKNAYMGEVMMERLSELLDGTDDSQRAERVRNALYDVSTRVQNLRVMEAVHQQYFVSIEMTRQNNTRLGQSVDNTITLAANVVTIGLAIQVALKNQDRVRIATQRTQEFLGDLVVANAEAIKQHTDEIGDLYTNPVIAIDKIAKAHDDLMDAMDTADRLKQEGIDTARTNIAELSRLSAELQERSSGLRERPALAEGSVEA